MALDFPSNPTNGQTYQGYVYSTSIGAWQAKPAAQSPFYTSDTPPANPTVGDAWFNTTDGTAYFYYYDGNTYQWVEGTAPISANGYYSPNYIINGAFDFWQRGTSFTATSGYSADRWFTSNNGVATTFARESTTVPAGFKYSMKVTAGAGSNNAYIQQNIETANCADLSGKTVTLSAYVSSSATAQPIMSLLYSTAEDCATSTAMNSFGSSTLSVGTSWARYTLTATVPATAKTVGLYIAGNGLANGQSLYIAGIQLESGSVATTFRRNANSIQGELAACHRYFRRYTSTTGDEIMWNGTWYEANGLWVPMIFPVPMRAKPTISSYGTINTYGGGGNSIMTSIIEYAGGTPTATGGVYVFKNAGGNTVGRAGFIGLANATNYIQFDAEL